MIWTNAFIQKYEKYYFKESYQQNDALGIKGIKATEKSVEMLIVRKLRDGIYDLPDHMKQINEKDIIDHIDRALENFDGAGNPFDAVRELTEAFNILKACNSDKRFGTEHMISTMSFLSRGRIPMYDKNAYKAIQALYHDRNPGEITVDAAPSAEGGMGAMLRLVEYMYLLDKVFGKDRTNRSEMFSNCEQVGYTSRGLARALWVYGQCTRRYVFDELELHLKRKPKPASAKR